MATASAEGGSFVWQRIGAVPSLALAAGLLAMAGVSASAAFANATARRAPEVAAQVWPLSASAQAGLAAAMVAETTSRTGSIASALLPQQVRRLAERSLRAEPGSVSAVRVLALYHQSNGDTLRARNLMRLAARLSLRDTVTNLWLVEDYLRAEDLGHATALIDINLRTDTRSSAVLLPQLAGLLAQPGGDRFLLELLQGGPPWSHDFWTAVLQNPVSTVRGARLRIALHGRGAALASGHDARLITQLVDTREFAQAFELYTAAREASSSRGLLAPIDWRLVEDGRFGSSFGADGSLRIEALAGAEGVVAQKLIQLPHGRYKLATKSSAALGQLSLRMVCAELRGEATFALTIDTGGDTSSSFLQDSSCRYVWLSVVLAKGDTDRSFTIEPISLRRQEGGS